MGSSSNGGSVAIRESYWVRHSEDVIRGTYGDLVRVKPKNLLKFGRNTSIAQDTLTTIATLGAGQANETYVSSNLITHIASGDNGDDQALVLEGHTIANNELTFVSQNVTLAGNTKTALNIPLARATRLYNNDTTALTGPVYVAQDVTFTSGVPQTANAIHLIIASGQQQSEKCSTAFSKVDYGLVTGVFASATRASATSNVDMELQIREFGKVFRPAFQWTVRTASQSSLFIPLNPYIIVPKNADVRIVATASAASTQVTAWFNSLIALIQS